jgi:trehalose 6-phosphate phosphatase
MTPDALRHALIDAHRDGVRAALITDIDGTISPIAPTPQAAIVLPEARTALETIARHLPLTAAITGRAAADGRAKVGLDGLVYVGNHGFERWIDGRVEIAPEAAAARPALEAVIAALRAHLLPGMFIEDKRATLSIHYRAVDDPAAVEAAFSVLLAEVCAAHGLAHSSGHRLYEVRPRAPIDKGTAFASLIAEYAIGAAVWLGDDVTDADAMRAARALRESGQCAAYAIGVTGVDGTTPTPVRKNADALLPGVESTAAWLSALARGLSG